MRRSIADLDDRAAKIGSALQAVETGMEHVNRLAVEGLEPVAEQALMLPDGLEQLFWRRVCIFAQERNDTATHAPLGIKAV